MDADTHTLTLRRFCAALLAVALVALTPPSTRAEIVAYSVVELPDDGGLHLWRYDYTLSGHPFGVGEGFDISFAAELYSSIEVLVAPVGWSSAVFLPDPEFFPDAQLLALADNGDTTLLQTLSVRFAWFGVGTPGAQPFDLFDAEFNVVASGVTVTTTAVPEPPVVPMLLVGLALLGLLIARRPCGDAS